MNNTLTEAFRRNSGKRDLDVSLLLPYYGVQNVFGTFTDNGDFELSSLDDKKDRPAGVVAYPINDMVGRTIKTSSFYVRLFRYDYRSSRSLITSQYTEAKLSKDIMLIQSYFVDDESLMDFIDNTTTKAALDSSVGNVPFAHLWFVLSKLSNKLKSVDWDELFTEILNYDSIYDDRGLGIIVSKKTPVLLVFDYLYVTDLEIIEILKNKTENNTYIRKKIERFNSLTSVSNARRRVKK